MLFVLSFFICLIRYLFRSFVLLCLQLLRPVFICFVSSLVLSLFMYFVPYFVIYFVRSFIMSSFFSFGISFVGYFVRLCYVLCSFVIYVFLSLCIHDALPFFLS